MSGDAVTTALRGIRVVEVAAGISAVGSGTALSLPGSILRDLGAEVARLEWGEPLTLDADVEFWRCWNRGKHVERVGDPDRVPDALRSLAAQADVLLIAGPEEELESRGMGFRHLSADRPQLVGARIRPSLLADGPIPDFELLVHARTGLLNQIRGHREPPIFCDLAVGGTGAGLAAAVGALALLVDRETSGAGGWVETSLLDGIGAILPLIIGRVEHQSPSTVALWEQQGPQIALSFRCADGEYVQLWFGAKGAYESFLEFLGDEPTVAGYTADVLSGEIGARSQRWAATFAEHDRHWWLSRLAGHAFRCEPVLRPAQVLGDPHLAEIGLAVPVEDPQRGALTVPGPVARVTPVAVRPSDGVVPPGDRGPFLTGTRVLDLSAYLAGPVTPHILAELGAEVVKIEPPTGDLHRSMEPMYAAGQRGKKALSLDLKDPRSRAVLERLFAWCDVVHHNSRVGLAEKLRYDEASVRAVNPDVVYSFASGFGTTGSRALLPANDHLMQALAGVEAAEGGAGNAPTFLVWSAIDVASGWIAASAVLAGLYARTRAGVGQSVSATLIGAAITTKSGAFLADGSPVGGPLVGPDQTGYGAAYRIYRAGDNAWLALAVPDAPAWRRLRALPGLAGLPDDPPPLRQGDGELQEAELLLEAGFATKPVSWWLGELRAAGVPAEKVLEVDRVGFVGRLLDDPVNCQLGRVVRYEWGQRGLLEQFGFPLRFGPRPRPAAPRHIAALGEDTERVLSSLGFGLQELAELRARGTVA